MKTRLLIILLMIFSFTFAQEKDTHKGHYNTSKFKQMTDLLPQPNAYRTASGAPGRAYYQNKADYDMKIELIDSENVVAVRFDSKRDFKP